MNTAGKTGQSNTWTLLGNGENLVDPKGFWLLVVIKYFNIINMPVTNTFLKALPVVVLILLALAQDQVSSLGDWWDDALSVPRMQHRGQENLQPWAASVSQL